MAKELVYELAKPKPKGWMEDNLRSCWLELFLNILGIFSGGWEMATPWFKIY